jgi:Tol biopolymer transport system component
VLQTPFHEREASVSPDGHWLAYESTSSGSFEVWVRPFPAEDTGAFRISTDGGTQALWARDGKTLFYIAGDRFLQEVAVDPKGSAWHNGPSTRVFERRYYIGGNSGRSYDVSLDGRFLMISAPGIDASDDPPGLIVVQHWDEELKRLVPTK